jgi:hypothetical protein
VCAIANGTTAFVVENGENSKDNRGDRLTDEAQIAEHIEKGTGSWFKDYVDYYPSCNSYLSDNM